MFVTMSLSWPFSVFCLWIGVMFSRSKWRRVPSICITLVSSCLSNVTSLLVDPGWFFYRHGEIYCTMVTYCNDFAMLSDFSWSKIFPSHRTYPMCIVYWLNLEISLSWPDISLEISLFWLDVIDCIMVSYCHNPVPHNFVDSSSLYICFINVVPYMLLPSLICVYVLG